MERLDGVAMAALIDEGEATSAELVAEAIKRCEEHNPALNAIVHTNFELAMERAETSRLVSSPVAGVPMVTKDLICREDGLPFHEGSQFLKSIDWIGKGDQDEALRFRDAGLVSIGRTNTPEFGMRPCTEPLAYGPTHNPWKAGHSPGGSSGGSAAAVAAGIVPIAHGNDLGGSLRNPASMCGLVGLKPSRGRSRLTPDFGDGMLGMAESLVLTRSVRDTAVMLDVLSASSADDVSHNPVPVDGWFDGLSNPQEPLRIGWHVPTGGAVDPAVAAAVENTANQLDELGHHVTEAAPAALAEDISAYTGPVLAAGTAWVVDQHWPRVAGIERTPEDQIEPGTAFVAKRGRAVSGADLLTARELGQQWTRRLLSWWMNDGFDLLLLPTIPVLPPRHGETNDLEILSLTLPFNLSGLPAASIPATVHEGLPIGVQLVGSMFREDHILAVAQQLQTVTGWLDWPAPTPS